MSRACIWQVGLVAVLLFPGCERVEVPAKVSDRPEWDGQSLLVGQPTIRPNPVERVPLVAIVDFETPVEVKAVLEISDGDRSWQQPCRTLGRQHHIPVLGMRPNRQYSIRVRLSSLDGTKTDTSHELQFTTDPLPDSFPPLQTTLSNPAEMEPGITLFAVNLWQESVSMLDYGYIIALDELGEVVWYCKTDDRIADMRVLSNGHLLYQHGSYRYAYEIDLLGRDIRSWYGSNLTQSPNDEAIAVAVDTMHHDLLELPNGHFMTLSTEIEKFDEYPTSEFDPDAPWEPAHVVCDQIVEFDPETGEIIDQLHLVELLDRKRFGYMALGGFWKDKYNDRIGAVTRDWCHANALIYLPDERAVIVSFRHLDCLMKIDWETKKIRWILGDPDGWGEAWHKYLLQPQGNLQWSYHHHAPQITPRGTIMLYDNGNFRARPFDEVTVATENSSRVVEYRVDEANMTVEQVYAFQGYGTERFYSPFYCEADWLPQTQNILVTDGGHIELEDGTPSDEVPSERQWARIFEVVREQPPRKVFEVLCASELGSRYGWSIYRANRRPNLYDGFSLEAPAPDEEIQLFERGRIEKQPE